METVLDLRRLYAGDDVEGEPTAKLDQLDVYIGEARGQVADGADVVLTGQAPIWLYLKIAHALHGVARRLYYDSPVTGRVLIFIHDPF